MTDSQERAGLSRRSLLLRGALVAGAGLALAAGEIAGAGTALASTAQPNWGWCSLCGELYWAGKNFVGQGNCPAQSGDGHATPGINYTTIYNQATTKGLPSTPGYQDGWYWCQNCFALYWPGTNPTSSCPGGKGPNYNHSRGPSLEYAMIVNQLGDYQGGWNYCDACGCMYHSNNGWGTDSGLCWVNLGGSGAEHTHGSTWKYQVTYT
jgi:hypothetical protein